MTGSLPDQPRVFVDHTGFHALSDIEVRPEDRGRRFRELLQFLEILLLADSVWIADSEHQPTLEVTRRVLGMLEKAGLAGATDAALVRYDKISKEAYRNALVEAGPGLWTELSSFPPERWGRLKRENGYKIRPAGAEMPDYPRTARMEFQSDEAEDFLRCGLQRYDWRATAGALLLNPSLYKWMRDFAAEHPNPEDSAYSYVNTLFRWHINMRLAQEVGDRRIGKGVRIPYAPAAGRATMLNRFADDGWARRLELMATEFVVHVKAQLGEKYYQMLVSKLGPAPDAEIPLIGLWFVLRLPESVNRDGLLHCVQDYRGHDVVYTVRKFLNSSTTDEYDIRQVAAKVRRDLGMPRQPLEGRVHCRWNALPPWGVKVYVEQDLPTEVANMAPIDVASRVMRAARRRLLDDSVCSVLVDVLGDIECLRLDSSVRERLDETANQLVRVGG